MVEEQDNLVPEQLTHTVDRLLEDFDVLDLTIADPPIEQIVGRLFKQGDMDNGDPDSPAADEVTEADSNADAGEQVQAAEGPSA